MYSAPPRPGAAEPADDRASLKPMLWLLAVALIGSMAFLAQLYRDKTRSDEAYRPPARVQGSGPGMAQRQASSAYPGSDAVLQAAPEQRNLATDESFLATFRRSGPGPEAVDARPDRGAAHGSAGKPTIAACRIGVDAASAQEFAACLQRYNQH
jgi:hypothetical protein